MATYKVLQDIEADDKLLGPMTLRQFIYAVITAVSGFIIFKLATTSWILAIPLVPHTILFAVLAAPFGHDQPNEVWLLARVRFALKPRKRVWSQSNIKELVTITAPKKPERQLTKNFSQAEVKSRLQALANTIDSHGWSTKNVNVNISGQPSYSVTDSDRLVAPSSLPHEVSNVDITSSDDMLDEDSNPTAKNFERLIKTSAQTRRQQIVGQLQQPQTQPAQSEESDNKHWFFSKKQQENDQVPANLTSAPPPNVISPKSSDSQTSGNDTGDVDMNTDEATLLKQLQENKKKKTKHHKAGPTPAYQHMRTIQPLSEKTEEKTKSEPKIENQPEPPVTSKHAAEPRPAKQQPKRQEPKPTSTSNQSVDPANSTAAPYAPPPAPAQPAPSPAPQPPVTATPDPDILKLANNNDLNVATIARQANKKQEEEPPTDEVVVSLH